MGSTLLIVALVTTLPTAAGTRASGPAPEEAGPVGAGGVLHRLADPPDEAVRAVAEGRFFHASLILRDYLSGKRDPTAEDLLLAARAEAGWDNWDRVASLLRGQTWLDTTQNGLGRGLLGRSLFELGQWAASIEQLDRYLGMERGPTDTDRGFAEFWRADAARAAGDYESAIASCERAARWLPDVSDWLLLEAAAAAAQSGAPRTVDSLLSRIDPELARERGWRLRVDARRRADDHAGALEAANLAASQLTSPFRRAAALVEMGRLRAEQDDVDGARLAFRRAIELSPGTSAGIDAARALSGLTGLTASDRLQIGRTWLRHGNMMRAADGMNAWLASGAGTAAERERVRYDIGDAWFRAGRYDDAERILSGVAERNIVPSVAADALYLAARSQYRDGRITLARRTFIDVADRYPREEAAARAMYLSADLDQDDGDFTRAAERFRRTTTLSPDIEEVGLAHMRLGGLAAQRNDWKAALEEFDRYRHRYPNGRRYIQATYWSALANRELGSANVADQRLNEVLRLDPLSYYGARARDLLGRSFWDLPLRSAPDTPAALRADVASALAVVDLLVRMDRPDAADYEIGRIRQRFAASRAATYQLAEELDRRGFTTTGIAIGWDLYRRDGGWNERLLHIIYPFPYREIIVAEARERGVDPFLAAGLIRQESMFNAAAISGAGAVGLMQVLPSTGRTLAGQLGLSGFSASMLEHAELNAHLGTRYLAEQLSEFNGRLPVVLAAYNAGPHRIDRWREFPEFSDDEQFAERIPFAETRDYVKIVQDNAHIYRELYGELVSAMRTGG